MQRLTTLLLLTGITFTAQAQAVDNYQPDADGDGCIGMSDLLSLLTVFGSCEDQAFACGAPVSYQGYNYATVQIGEHCWFAENLRNENYQNGDAILSSLSNSEWSNTSSGAGAVFGEGISDCISYYHESDPCDDAWSLNEYGRLYNWYSVDDVRGMCPSGWHIPSEAEWTFLVNHLGGLDMAATKMKTTYGWLGEYGVENNTNSSGFSGLPGGLRTVDGSFLNGDFSLGNSGFWWSSTFEGSNAWCLGLTAFDGNLVTFSSNCNPAFGLSIRCIQDSEE